jgi:type I restriction enzyme S subunit
MIITKGESPRWQGYDYISDGIPFIRSENVLWGNLNESDMKSVPQEFHDKLKRSQVKPNDLLINIVGASIGRCCLVPDTIKHANLNQAVAFIRLKNILNPMYVMYLMLSPIMQDIIRGSQVETARPNISLTDLRNYIIPIPPRLEQNEIVENIEHYFTVSNTIESIICLALKQSERLRQSILKVAFEGKLVAQDPNDEPAEKLLECIKAGRAQQSNQVSFNKKRSSKQEESI